MKNRLIIILFLFLVGIQNSLAQVPRMSLNMDNRYDENIYAISDYSGLFSQTKEVLSFSELLYRQFDGFILEVVSSDNGEPLLINANRTSTPFNSVLESIRSSLENDTSKILTLLLDLDSIEKFEHALEKAGLMQYVMEQSFGDGWPTLRDMVTNNQRLVLFSIKNLADSPAWLLNLDTYASWQISPFLNSQPIVSDYPIKEHDKSLFIFNGYSSIERMWLMERNMNNIRLPYFIEPFKNVWISTGHIPNFVLIDAYDQGIYEFFRTIRASNLVQGSISYNNEILDEVMWKGYNSTTEGLFSFPLMSGDKLELTPMSSGYNITPESIIIDETYTDYPVTFTATPMSISDGLELYLQLDKDVNNYNSKKNNGVEHNINFIIDPIRGQVASFGESSKIDLPTAKELNITDHDFTISAWVKISKYVPNKRDYCIIGAELNNEVSYLRRMHFLIRDKKPYFGFFANDITGNTIIEAGRWYHLACRFNSVNGEQAIFVNGKLDSRSFNLPSYKGSDSLFVGIYSNNSYFNGEIDNLAIWSRVLGDKEILGISNGLLYIDTFHIPREGVKTIYIVISSVFVILLFIAYYILKKRGLFRTKVEKVVVEDVGTKDFTTNYIRLFGDFLVIDNMGNDITSKFSPKIKQLFLAILVNSGTGHSGITSSELSKCLWGKNSSKETDNLRGVTIRKLRGILNSMDKVDIVFHGDRWTVQLSNKVYCDYVECTRLIMSGKAGHKKHESEFLKIVCSGELFKNESFAWLDSSKGFLSSSIVDVLLKYLDEPDPEKDTIEIANTILVNDPVNDVALAYKLEEMIRNNNKTLARFTFDQFRELYQEMYGVKYAKTFEEFIANIPSMDSELK